MEANFKVQKFSWKVNRSFFFLDSVQQFLFEITSFLTLKVACGRNLAEEDWNKETNRPIPSRWHVRNARAGKQNEQSTWFGLY